jgi:NAD(P)-dependent dehydrogenase (short-subunit alcohol dehydrogenase family)
MHGQGDPGDAGDVVRLWLATPTWDESFEVLRASAQVMVTQAGLDAANAQADGAERAVHASILQAVAAGFPIDAVQRLVTDGQAALDLAMQALTRRDGQTVILVLSLNPGLLQTPLGTALVMAAHLAASQGEDIRVAARRMAHRAPTRPGRWLRPCARSSAGSLRAPCRPPTYPDASRT